jgi:uncharacterized membrane protein YfcA
MLDSDSLILLAVAAWCFLVALVGTSIGIVLGTIRLPILLLLATSPAAGAGANVGVSAVSAAAASVAHIRAGRVNWRLAAWMTPPSMAGALIGGYAAGLLPDRDLLIMIGALLFGFGVRQLRRPRAAPSEAEPAAKLDKRAAVVIGFLVGVLGGLVGLILSTLRVPAMVSRIGETPHRAVGTNVIVGFALGVAGVIGHLPSGVDWDLLLLGSAASVPGAMVGSRLVGRLSERQLLNAIGVALLIVGAATVGRGLAS